MIGPVKSTRRYESPRRRAQAEETRRTILESAQRLFERQGFGATTMAAVAAAAGVALKTVYVAFETKSGLLRALWHLRLRGDTEDLAVQDRRWYLDVIEEPDPVRQLRLTARNSRAVKERVGGLFGVIRSASLADPEIEALWGRIQAEFHENQRSIVESIAEKGALRPALDVSRASDILWALNHPDTWSLLVRERGWTPEEYETWLGDTATAQLLTARAARSRRRG